LYGNSFGVTWPPSKVGLISKRPIPEVKCRVKRYFIDWKKWNTKIFELYRGKLFIINFSRALRYNKTDDVITRSHLIN
jgi:hypothetical protein